MQLPPILILVLLSVRSVYASMMGENESPSRHEVVIPALLERRKHGNSRCSSPGSDSLASMNVAESIQRRANLILEAWRKRGKLTSYGGGKAYEVPRRIFRLPVVIKKILINDEGDKVAARQEVAIIEHVGQLVDLGIADDGKIWLVVQRLLGLPVDTVPLLDRQLGKLRHIQKSAVRYYAQYFGVKLPEDAKHDPDRYRLRKEGDRWVGKIVGWKGGQRVPLLPGTKPKTISSKCLLQNNGRKCKSEVALAWRRKVTDQIIYGGETAYHVPEGIYDEPVVIKEILIKNEAEETVASQEIAILERLKRLMDWAVVYQGDRRTWLVVQQFIGCPEEDVKGIRVDLLRERARSHYQMLYELILPENDMDNPARYRFVKAFNRWDGIIVGWKGGQNSPLVLDANLPVMIDTCLDP